MNKNFLRATNLLSGQDIEYPALKELLAKVKKKLNYIWKVVNLIRGSL